MLLPLLVGLKTGAVADNFFGFLMTNGSSEERVGELPRAEAVVRTVGVGVLLSEAISSDSSTGELLEWVAMATASTEDDIATVFLITKVSKCILPINCEGLRYYDRRESM